MTTPEEDEAELRAIFDRTALEASGVDLTRLRARAEEVPERAARKPRLLPRWLWAPALAGAFASAGALGAALLSGVTPVASVSSGPVATSNETAPAPERARSAELRVDDATDDSESETESDDWVGEHDELAFDLSPDVPDTELDAWLEAAREFE